MDRVGARSLRRRCDEDVLEMRVVSPRTSMPRVRVAALALLILASLAAHGGQAAPAYPIGFVSPTAPGPTFDAFRQGLKEAGYAEGENVVLRRR